MGILLSLLMLLGLLFSLLVMLMGILISLLVMIMMMLFSLLVMLYMILLIVLLFLMEYHTIQRYLCLYHLKSYTRLLVFLIKKKKECLPLDWKDVRLLRYFLDKDNYNIHGYLSIDRSPGAGKANHAQTPNKSHIVSYSICGKCCRSSKNNNNLHNRRIVEPWLYILEKKCKLV